MTDPASDSGGADAAERIRQIIADCSQHHAAGEQIDEQAIISAHPELMPALGEELAHWRRIVDARAEAEQPLATGSHADLTRSISAEGKDSPSRLPQTLALDELQPEIHIEGYDLLSELQRGGQGVVYQAVQRSTKRKVAIKVLLEGPYASRATKIRFEREIELAAQLKHTNIISVYHSGSTADGRQYYVMDYVRGQPLNRYVRDKNLTLEETLGLFRQVCDAVQFAHQRGIIHRDLKPTNILVGADGVPKLLDFGFAKWLAAPVETVVSISQAVMGTLPYMSPEQTAGNPEEVDTRADIYALGVILYELLTGHYPYPVVGRMADVLHHIAATAPTPPTSGWTRDSGVTRRSGRSVRVGQCPIDSDLQTVVLKTLAKERDRRYQSAAELARDINHYLADEPIEAKRDSGWYLLRKGLHRHRTAVAVVAAFVLLLVIGGFMIHGGRMKTHAQSLVTEGQFLEQRDDRQTAYARYEKAMEQDPKNHDAIYLAALLKKREYFSMRFDARPRNLLEISNELCDRALAIEPEHRGVLNLKSTVLYSLGRLTEAEQACRRVLGIEPKYFYANSILAKVLALQGRLDEAVQAVQNGIDANRAAANRDKYDDGLWRTLTALQHHLGQDSAYNSAHEALAIDHRDTRNQLQLARIHLTLPAHQDFAEALRLAELARVFTSLRDPRFDRILAQAYLRNERYADAARHAQAAVASGDEPAYGHLLAAAAEARLGRADAAAAQLELARKNWPRAFKEEEVFVTAEKGMLWFDTLAELNTLRDEAERLVAAAPKQQP